MNSPLTRFVQRCLNPDCHFESTPRGGAPQFATCPFCRGPLERVVHRTISDCSMLSAALKYLASGKSVFPVVITADGKKRPLVKWGRFQTRLPTPDEVHSWWTRWPQAAIGMVTGAISGRCAVDIDPRNGGDLQGKTLPAGLRSRTMHGGNHNFFKPPPTPLRTRCSILPGVDFKGEGGFVVLPPSPGYTWVEEGELPELPQWVVDLVLNGPRHSGKGRKRATQTRLPLAATDHVRFNRELNAKCWRRRLHWPAILWAELRALDQRLGGSGFIPYPQAMEWLIERGFTTDWAIAVLGAGNGTFWTFIERGPVKLIIHLQGVRKVCEALGVNLPAPPELPEWQTIPLGDFQGDKRLPYFRSVACYEPVDSEGRKISRRAIQEKSGVSVRTQIRDDEKIGLLQPAKGRNQRRKHGQFTYRLNMGEGPRFLQEPSILKGAAFRGPVGILAKVQRAIEGGSLLKTGRTVKTVEALHPWKWYRTDAQYQQAVRKCAKGILAGLVLDDNPEVAMTRAEKEVFRVRRSVSLWRTPASVVS